MRARQFRPSFDALLPRITPSDLSPVIIAAVQAPAGSPTTASMSGMGTGVIDNLGDWQVGGTPVIDPVDVLQSAVDPTTWILVNG